MPWWSRLWSATADKAPEGIIGAPPSTARTPKNIPSMQTPSFIVGKDASLERTIATLEARLAALGFHVEERSWLNPTGGIWSVPAA